LAGALETLARAAGATVLTSATATGIICADGRVAGVSLADGSVLPCAFTVHAGDPAALSQGLLGAEARKTVPQRATDPRSHSAWVWAFSARPLGLPLSYHNVLFAADPAREFAEIARGEMPGDPSLYICAQDRASSAPAGAERFEIILNAPPLPPGGPANPEEEYHRCRTRTFQTLARFGLTFDPLPEASALAGPGHFARMFPGSGGAIYGLSPQGLTASFRRPGTRTRLPGLYLAGGGVHPGAGIPMATLSGRHAAEAIMQDRASTFRSVPMATPGGTSMVSPTMAGTPSRSSPS
jgi:1-hydroxycarotenoid 3,4-desaturase